MHVLAHHPRVARGKAGSDFLSKTVSFFLSATIEAHNADTNNFNVLLALLSHIGQLEDAAADSPASRDNLRFVIEAATRAVKQHSKG